MDSSSPGTRIRRLLTCSGTATEDSVLPLGASGRELDCVEVERAIEEKLSSSELSLDVIPSPDFPVVENEKRIIIPIREIGFSTGPTRLSTSPVQHTSSLVGVSANEPRFTLRPDQCLLALVIIKRQKCESKNPRALSTYHQPTAESRDHQSCNALSSNRPQGEKCCVQRSLAHLEILLEIRRLTHSHNATVRSGLEMTKFILCLVDKTDIFLDTPLTLHRTAALAPCPPDRPSALIPLAIEHSTRFEKEVEGGTALLETLLHDAVHPSSAESHDERAPTSFAESPAGRDIGPDQACSQSFVEPGSADEDPLTLGPELLHRFERFGDLPALQQAISVLEAFVSSTSVSDLRYLAGLSNLGAALWNRFIWLGELNDLEQAITKHQVTVDLCPNGHPDKATYLNNLGLSLVTRFERFGKSSDLEQAIARIQDALHTIPEGHPYKATCLNNLGISIQVHYENLGSLDDVETALSTLKEAIDLTPEGHPDRPDYLNNLGLSLTDRFSRFAELDDLERAVSRLEEAVKLTHEGHLRKADYLKNLGNSLVHRFVRLGDLNDLERAVIICRDAVELTPNGHFRKPNHLHGLGIALDTRFQRFSELGDLEQAILRLKAALNLTPDGHPKKPGLMAIYGKCVRFRFSELGELNDLEQATSMNTNAVNLTPGHPNKHFYLVQLGHSLQARFARFGELSDLEQAISSFQEAADLVPGGHRLEPYHLNHLSVARLTRFRRIGDLTDLDQAISRMRDAVNLTPDGHPIKPCWLSNLGSCFGNRFEHLGEPTDLEQAISLHKDAMKLTPDGDNDKIFTLTSLCGFLATRFHRIGEPGNFDQSISELKDAVDATSDCHSFKFNFQDTLARCCGARFEGRGEASDLEQAITRQKNALRLIPEDHPDKATFLSHLGDYLKMRFDRFGISIDLEEAISVQKVAVNLVPEGHPEKPSYLETLANLFRVRFGHFNDTRDLEQAISLYSRAACASVGPTTVRFRASREWISAARSLPHSSLLHGYSVAISLLPQLAWIGLPLTHRYRELAQAADVVREAAAAALDSGNLQLVVEWLEKGRSIVWGELFRLRSPYEELTSTHPDHARRLRELSAALEHAGTTRERSAASSLEQEADRYQTLAIERDKLLQEIRRLPGFEQFLLHTEFSRLRASARSGPVVILNAAESRCDALIVLADKENVMHVPLPNFTIRRAIGLQSALDGLLGPARVIPSDNRTGQPASRHDSRWESMLSTLWKGVVEPVLDALGLSISGGLSRVFWCPTGPFTFLPIHAAGLYGAQYSKPGHKAFDFVVSSYVPTLSVLSPSIQDTAPSGNLHILAVPQPPSDGLIRLPGVHTEVAHIKSIVKSCQGKITLLESSVGTVEEVLGLMKDADWVHFACHGVQDTESPSNSGLCLADERRLKLSDIILLSRPRSGLAFLSACQTAMGDKKLSDEAVHVAAGMLSAGYGGVIGTMWSISDRVAPRVAKDVYGQLLRGETTPDYREAARALHNAVARLRDSDASFVEWVPFIHVGL